MITAVLITREKEFPADVLELIKKEPRITEILIETECPHIWRRFELAAKAKNDLIYTQDDDCYVENIDQLIKTFDGKQIVYNCQASHYSFYSQKCGNKIALIGWGSIFKKEWLKAFDRYFEMYPKRDELFDLTADRVFTWLNAPHRVILGSVRHHELEQKARMSTRPGEYHWQELDIIIARLRMVDVK